MAPVLSDTASVQRLDDAWNDAYRRHDRSALADILADDFVGFTAAGDPISKAALMIDPPQRARSVAFSEQEIWIAVGTLIAERPPHRTVRAAFPHTAPTLGI